MLRPALLPAEPTPRPAAWPHYLPNGPRYAAYAKATALGYAHAPAEERGLAFLLRSAQSLAWDMPGPGEPVLAPEELWSRAIAEAPGVNAALPELRRRLGESSFASDLGPVAGGPDSACAIHAVRIDPHRLPVPPRPLVRPEIRLPAGVAG